MPSLMPSRLTRTKALLVEGKDECNFFEAFFDHLKITDVEVRQVFGKDRFPIGFEAFLNDPGFDRLTAYAIIRDADKSRDRTFQSVADLLKRKGQPFPGRIGEFVKSGPRKVGVF